MVTKINHVEIHSRDTTKPFEGGKFLFLAPFYFTAYFNISLYFRPIEILLHCQCSKAFNQDQK